MKKVIHYVLYSEQQAAQLKDKPYFTPILTINATQIEVIDTAFIFNTQKAFEKLNHLITNKEIAHTLSHIKCWKAIAENNKERFVQATYDLLTDKNKRQYYIRLLPEAVERFNFQTIGNKLQVLL